jgi:hypothetical protein
MVIEDPPASPCGSPNGGDIRETLRYRILGVSWTHQ